MAPTLWCLCVMGQTNGAEALPESSALTRPTVGDPCTLASAEIASLMHGADPLVFVRDGADEWSRSAARILGLNPPNGRRPMHPRVRRDSVAHAWRRPFGVCA